MFFLIFLLNIAASSKCCKSLKVHLNIERIWLEPIKAQLSNDCSPVWFCRWINCRETVSVMDKFMLLVSCYQDIMNKRRSKLQ